MSRRKQYTNFAKASTTEMYDLQTDTSTPTIIGIHSPMSSQPMIQLNGFFTQFKRFKYLGCTCTLVPASTLPADPLQISYEAGETTIDPRDMVNPLLFKGCHGVDLPRVLRDILPQGDLYATDQQAWSMANVSSDEDNTSGNLSLDQYSVAESTAYDPIYDADTLEKVYYQCLTDPTWKKSSLQSGARMRLYPLVQKLIGQIEWGPTGPYKVNAYPSSVGSGVVNSTYPNHSVAGSAFYDESTAVQVGYGHTDSSYWPYIDVQTPAGYAAPVQSLIYSNGWTRLGWMPTRPFALPLSQSTATGDYFVNTLPRIMMGCLFLPPAYKTEFYFRVVVRHHWQFKDYTTSNLLVRNTEMKPESVNYYSSDSTTSAASTSSLDLTSGEATLVAEYATSE